MWRLRATSILSLLNGALVPRSYGDCSRPCPASAPRLPLGLLSRSHVLADQAVGTPSWRLLPGRYGQPASIAAPVAQVSAPDWHTKGQVRDPHLVSWRPIVSCPHPSAGHGSTPHARSSPPPG